MTDRQREVLSFIRGYFNQHGIPPTLTEIARGTGLAHRSTVHSHVQALVRDGHLIARETTRETTVVAYYPVEHPAAA